jgi:glycosyltransferase involved in cell wall biosynthesis
MSFVIARDAGKLPGRLYLAMSRLLIRFPIGLMVCTNDGSPWFRLFPTGSRNRLLLITNGVDRPMHRKPRSLAGSQKPVIAFVGRATIAKGLDVFVQICTELKTRGLAFSAQVIGDGKFRKQAEEIVATNGLSDIVNFLGKIPHRTISAHLSGVDVYVTPARNGVFSNTTLEAIAAGCCVVGFAPDERTGVDVTTMKFAENNVIRWVPRDDAERGFANTVAELLKDVSQIQQQSVSGIQFSQSALPTWPERIRHEADLLGQFVHSHTVMHGAMPGDRLARIAFEAAT